MIRRYSPEGLSDLLKLGSDSYQKSILLADLLILHARMMEDLGKTAEEIASTLKAYCLIADSIGVLGKGEEPVYRAKLGVLAQKLSLYENHPYIREVLSKYDPVKTKRA
jgi:hypothetical protein